MVADPSKWLLDFSDKGGGRPWGDETFMAMRRGKREPWDENCRITPLIGGYEGMSSIRESLEAAIDQAKQGKKGHVYIANWRLNPLRDLSEDNPWIVQNRPWNESDSAVKDQTIIGLILRLMQSGISVRILLWMPMKASIITGLGPHMSDHNYLAEVISNECKRLSQDDPSAIDRGIVALDMRVAPPATSTHHQKMIVIRVGDVNVAYCGGMDLAFTRRDAPDPLHPYKFDPKASLDDLVDLAESNPPQFLGGDWQSGEMLSEAIAVRNNTYYWPRGPEAIYDALKGMTGFIAPEPDLPNEVYGSEYQIWHDQQLKLEGPIVKTLEEQFAERWQDGGRVYETGFWGSLHLQNSQVIFSSNTAIKDGKILPLPLSAESDQKQQYAGSSIVQMWRTIPLRPERNKPPFLRGEFTIMAGISNACQAAEELIWIFDQYFFSRPLARLLNHRIKSDKGKKLCVILILPPHADEHALEEHHARKLALDDLTEGLSEDQHKGRFERVAVYDLWHPTRVPGGIYCHAKVQMYDRSLLVCGSANLNRRSFTCDTELDCAVLDDDLVRKHYSRLWRVLFPDIALPEHIDFSDEKGGWGRQFFDAFKNAARSDSSFLIPDPWWNSIIQIRPVNTNGKTTAEIVVKPPRLPANPAEARKGPESWTGVKREQDFKDDYLEEARTVLNNPYLQPEDMQWLPWSDGLAKVKDALMDPSSINMKVESEICPDSINADGDPRSPGRLDEIVFLIENCGQGDNWPYRVS